MKKIIHVLTDTNIGGAGMWLLNFLRGMKFDKYQISVALPYNAQLKPKIEKLGIKVHEVKYIADSSFSKKGIKELKKLFKEENPDIIHAHASLSARIAAKQLGIKTVNTRHCLEEEKPPLKRVIYSTINNFLSDIVIGVSKAACENLINDGTKKEKVRLCYNGVYPLEKFSQEQSLQIKKEYNIPEDDVVVGIVARLEKVKNHEMFLKAAKDILSQRENVTFLIVGDGSQMNSLKTFANELGIAEKVVFCGYLEDITGVMNIIDINTLVSEKEALSLSLIEGMSISKCSVSTDSGGPGEVIADGVSGIIVPNNDVESFKKALISLIDDEEKRRKMGDEGKIRAQEIFGIDKMIENLTGIYDSLVK